MHYDWQWFDESVTKSAMSDRSKATGDKNMRLTNFFS